MKLLILITTAFLIVGGCQSETTKNTDSGVPNIASEIKEISPSDAQVEVAKAYSQFVDIRSAEEYKSEHPSRAINIPLNEVSKNLDKLEKNEPVYLICESGHTSKTAAKTLQEAGFNNVLNVTGGMVEWRAAGLPMETKPPHFSKAGEDGK